MTDEKDDNTVKPEDKPRRGRPPLSKPDERDEIIAANKELFEANAALRKNAELQAKEMAEIKAMIAKNVPASFTNYYETADKMDIHDGVAEFVGDTLIKPVTESMDNPAMQVKAEYEKFMTDMVTVHIQSSSEHPQFIKSFDISVNGKKEIFRENEQKTVQRKYVEGLARAKKTAFSNKEYVDANGIKAFKYPATTGIRYGFSVVHDPHPRGMDWLAAVLRQP